MNNVPRSFWRLPGSPCSNKAELVGEAQWKYFSGDDDKQGENYINESVTTLATVLTNIYEAPGVFCQVHLLIESVRCLQSV